MNHEHYAVHPQIYRLRYAAGEFRPRRAWDVTLLQEPVASDFVWDESRLRLGGGQTDLLELMAVPDCREVTLDDLPEIPARPGDALPPGPARLLARMRLRRRPELHCHGLGQRVCGLRRDPGRYCNWTVDPPWGHHKALHSLYQAHPYLLQVRPGLAVGLMLNCTWFSQFDLGESEIDEIVLATLGGELDLFVLAGRDAQEVCELLAALTGYPLDPPVWALGYHQSRWGYKEQSEIEDLVREFRTRKIPLDVIHLDIDYMWDFRSFTFDPERFPDPPGLARSLQEQGVRLVSIIDPGIRWDLHTPEYTVAREGAAAGYFLRNKDGSPFVGYCWPDAAVFTDYTDADARVWWGKQTGFLTEAGVSGIWIDMNEPAIFTAPFSEGHSKQNPAPLGMAHSDGAVHAEVHNLYGHLMAKATFEGMPRPAWVLTRSAFLGTQRYAISWMGDNNSWWEHLENSLPQLMAMGLCAAPFVGVDVGGFFGNSHPELLVRWMELGAFYPFMRNHSAMGTRPQEPWVFGAETEALVRKQIELRYRFLPYFETLAKAAHERGWPWLRPLFYNFPHDPESYHHDSQACVGPWLMIAPVSKAGHTQRAVYFPPGRWFDFWTDASVDGPAHRMWPAPLGQMPIFLREGACVPMGPVRQSTAEGLGELTWLVCPGPEDSVARYGDWEVRVSGGEVVLSRPADVELRGPAGASRHQAVSRLQLK